MIKQLISISLIASILSYSCANVYSEKKDMDSECIINGIQDFHGCKEKFEISEIKDMGSAKTSRLFLYKSSCKFAYQKDSIISIKDYIFTFLDSSNTQIEVSVFSSANYANWIAKELQPFVSAVRSSKSSEKSKGFCLNYYLSIIYNFAVKKNTIYFFGYDAANATSENITLEKLKHLDDICNALK